MTSDDGGNISWFSEIPFLKIWRYAKKYVEHIQFVGFSEIAFAKYHLPKYQFVGNIPPKKLTCEMENPP